MPRRRILNLLLFILIGSESLVGQKNTCSFHNPVSITFGYARGNPEQSVIPNEMISVIAEDAIRSPRRIFFTLKTEIQIRIEPQKGRNPAARITFESNSLTGDIRFRTFSMAKAMTPDEVSFSVRIQNRDSSYHFDLPQTTGLKWLQNDSSLSGYELPYFSCDSDTVVIRHLLFTFTQANRERFRERVSLINDYYAASAVLDSLNEKVRTIELGKINFYPGYFIILEELNKILEILKERNFFDRLGLDLNDPAGYTRRYDELTRFSHSATRTFSENLKTPGPLNLQITVDSLVSQFLGRISCYIRWSMLVSERNSGIYKEFLDRFYTMPAFGEEREVILNLTEKVFPGQDRNTVLAMISSKINQAYHDRAGRLMNNQQYPEAVELLRNIRLFSEVNPYLRGTVNDRETITKAANGIYDSFLGVAEIAILNGKEAMARSYMLRAQNYRKEHAGYVTSDSLFNKVFSELVTGSLSPCDTLYASSKYPDALQCYLEFENGFDSLTLSLIHRTLEPKIQFCRYKMLITEGEKNLLKNDKPEAGRYFFLARQLAADKKIPSDTLLDSLCRETYPYYLVHLLNAGEVWVWTGQLGRARQFADSIAYLQRTTGVGGSRDLSDALSGFRRKLDKRICWNANETVDVMLLRAQQKREMKNFMTAASVIDSVEGIIRQNPDCLIPHTGLSDTVKKYAQAVDFQKMLQRIELQTLNGDYDNAISGLMEINRFYRSENIPRFGLDSISMFDFIRGKSIQALTVSAFLYFQAKNDLEDAFTYLKLLRLQNYSRNYAKPFLEWTGKEFAGRDFRDQTSKDPVIQVRNYTGFDPWMKRFRFAYYSQAQHLRHRPGILYLFRKFFP